MASIDQHAQENVCRLLVGTKEDLAHKRVVSYEEGKALADEYGMNFFEVTAKASTNVEEAFMSIAKDIKRKMFDGNPNRSPGAPSSATVSISEPSPSSSSSKCC